MKPAIEVTKTFHFIDPNLPRKLTPIAQIGTYGSIVRIIYGLSNVRKYGFDVSSVIRCCQGKKTDHKGYKFKYADR